MKKEWAVSFASCWTEIKEEREETEMQPRVLSIGQPSGSLGGVICNRMLETGAITG